MRNYLGLGFILLIVFSCSGLKPQNTIENKGKIILPDTFVKSNTSIDSFQISNKVFFTDSFLLDLIDKVVLNNYGLKIDSANIDINHAEFIQRRAALLPALSLNLRVGAERFGNYTIDGVGNFDTNLSPNISSDKRIPTRPTPDYFLGLNSAWEIDIWGKLKSQKKAALYRYMQSQASHRFLITRLVSEISILYYEYLGLNSELKILNKNIELQERAYEIIQIQKVAGEATELAVQLFRNQLLNTKTIKNETKQLLAETENRIHFLMGKFPAKLNHNDSFLIYQIPDFTIANYSAKIILDRPDIIDAEYEIKASNADVKAAKAAFYPQLNFNPFAGLHSFESRVWFSPESFAFAMLGNLTAPIFQQRVLKTNLKKQRAAQKKAYLNYYQKVLGAYHEVYTLMQASENLLTSIQLKNEQIEASKMAVNYANDLFLGGKASYLEVINAQQGLLSAELDFIRLKKYLLQTRVNIYAAFGGGWK